MRFYVGTSGWSYSWNPDGFKWYLRNSGLNAVELNASFYRFPFPSMIKSWVSAGELRWSIKVHRSMTHLRLLKPPRVHEIFSKFARLMEPLEDAGLLDFYLFQFPPQFRASKENWSRIVMIAEEFGLGERMAVEWRNQDWFSEDWIDRAREAGITVVSVDSPEFSFYDRSSGSVYLRMHGRTAWYAHDYSEEELKETAKRAVDLGAHRVYVFFNNDHAMLSNAKEMLEIFGEL